MHILKHVSTTLEEQDRALLKQPALQPSSRDIGEASNFVTNLVIINAL